MIDRRRALRALPGGVAALAMKPAAARAQRTSRMPTVGWAAGEAPLADISGPEPANLPARASVHGLRDLGWIDGRTITLLQRSAESRRERAAAILDELISRPVDVLFLAATDWLIDAAHAATKSVPMVAIMNRDPVATGLVASLGRPGGNLTGLTTSTGFEINEKRLQLIGEVLGRIDRIAFLGTRLAWDAYRRGVPTIDVPMVPVLVDGPQDFDAAFAVVVQERVQSVVVSHGPILFSNAPRIVAFAAEKRIPVIFPWREATDSGGLMSYGSSAQGLFRQAAGYVDRILKGAHPAELPIEQPKNIELVVNMRTARALGLTIPPSILIRADEVIE